jgi:alkane 1-monooxygenase
LAAFSIPVVVFLSLYLGGYWSFLALVYAFGILPGLELILPESAEHMSNAEEEMAKQDNWYDYLLYAMVPIQYALLFFFLWQVQNLNLQVYEIVGMTLAMGISCGVIGINVAHELGHRRASHERVMAKLLLMTSLYMHFIIEHNRGHHRRVSTKEDPSSARLGESVYTFWLRSTSQAYLSAWELEADLMKKKGKRVLSLNNEMIRFTIFQLLFIVGIFVIFGPIACLAFLGAAIIGFLLLESVNYIEHYGLSRDKISPGRYEKVRPVHSWNSDHPIGRMVLFELSRHSDHHAFSGRKYQVLRHYDESPQMPAGYPAMVVLSLVPPLWFSVMHRHMKNIRVMKDKLAGV